MGQVSDISVNPSQAGLTIAALLRQLLPGQSWSDVRRLVEVRRVRLNDELCLDPARRVKEGDRFELLAKPQPAPRLDDNIRVRHLDEHLVVVEKPSGLNSVRHPSEREWNAERKALSPALEELVPKHIARLEGRAPTAPLPLLPV